MDVSGRVVVDVSAKVDWVSCVFVCRSVVVPTVERRFALIVGVEDPRFPKVAVEVLRGV